MKVKTKTGTVYEITNIVEKTSKEFYAYWNDYYIGITKEKPLSNGNKRWYIQCTHPDGCYIYDGYFHGTFTEALKDVFWNIELP
jgi:hypothetical protein